MKRVCIVTGTRAEYGLLKPLAEKIQKDKDLQLQLIATGMHLSPEFGYTYKQIIEDGFHIDEKVEILLSSDTSVGISKSTGLALISFSEVFARIKPDIVVILGDRYEMLAVAIAAMLSNIPIAHLHGGETTEGASDEAIRHSISKMSYLHFTSTEMYRKRIIQLGENPERVFNVGAMSVEIIKKINLLTKTELEKELLTFHPTTLENDASEQQIKELLKAIEKFDDINVIFTKANSDKDGRIINSLIDEFVKSHPERCLSFDSMGQLRYLTAMKYCSFVIGNSSSGIIEAPILGVPTINIGDRQKGRIQTKSIINCQCIEHEIIEAIKRVVSKEFKDHNKNIDNPYGNGHSSDTIVRVIKNFLLNDKIDLKKKFHNINQ